MNQKLTDLLNTDPVTVAENVTGRAVTPDPANPATMLAMGLQFKLTEERNKLLTELGDTMFGNEQARYEAIITEMGFQQVYNEPLPLRERDPNSVMHFYVWANPNNGTILVYDTYSYEDEEEEGQVTRINGASVYYCWKPDDREAARLYTASGGMQSITNPDWRRDPQFCQETEHGVKYTLPDDAYWQGDHDAREALRHNINQLASHGKFFTIWPRRKMATTMLLVSVDFGNGGFTTDEIMEKRYEALPQWVRAIINRG